MASPDDVWLTDFGDPYPGEPANFRPAIVIGPSASFGRNSPFAIVVPTTTVHRRLSLHIEIEPDEDNGLQAVSYAQCEMLRSVNRRRLVKRLGAIGPSTSLAIDSVVRSLLGH